METLQDYIPLNPDNFTAAVSAITSTGSSSGDLQSRVQAALTALTACTDVTAILTEFTRAVAGLVGVEQLRSEAETIAIGIAGVSNDNTNAATSLAAVSQTMSPLLILYAIELYYYHC